MKKSRYGIIILAALLVAGCGGPPDSARRAQRLLNAGEYEEAEKLADQELARFPKQPLLWRVKIQAAIGRRDAGRAVKIYYEWKQLRGDHDRTAIKAMALSTLWQGLYTPSAKVKIAAIQAAERLDLAPLADSVSERLGDDDPAVAAAAAIAILRWHPDAPYVATQSLSSDDPRARAIAVEGIARKVGVHARLDLIPLFRDPDAKVRRALVRAVWKFATADDIDQVKTIASADENGSVRAAALRALAQKDFAGAVDLGRAALRDDFLGARLAGLHLIDKRGGDAANDDLTVVAAGDDLFLALRAAVALNRRGHEGRTVAIAKRAVKADSWSVRSAAMNAIAEVASKQQALPMIHAALKDEHVNVRLAAARALLRFKEKKAARAALIAALQSNSDAAKVQAAIDLVRMEDSHGRTTLDELAQAASPDTRKQAVRALLQVGDATDGLVRALADESPEVRIIAADVALTLFQ